MRVLMFGWEYPPHIAGGLGTACLGMTRGLLHQGVELSFVLPKLFGGEENGERMHLLSAEEVGLTLTEEETAQLLTHLRIVGVDSFLRPYMNIENVHSSHDSIFGENYTVQHFSQRHFTFTGSYGKSLLEEVTRYALVASSIGSKEKFDIIHAHDWLTYLAGLAAKRVSGKPLVVHVHATEFDRSGENVNQLVYNIERVGMEGADKVIAVSHRTRDIVIERYGIAPEKVVTVHNAVEFSDDQYGAIQCTFPEKVVTFLGRVTFQKGPDYFVEAAYKVLQKMDNVRFVMAGSGDMLNRMIRRVAALGMGTKFHFAGFLKGAEVDRMYRMSDVYVMPSVSEPFGITPLEAMRNGVPVIISKQSGVAEVLKYALKVDFWDVDAMANAIYGLLNYNALQHFFQEHGQEEVTTLKWDVAALRIKEVYESLL
ncbi:MAG: glycosyltransferase family 4 protein [Bacteroides sp.]